MIIRRASVSGYFYPNDKEDLKEQVIKLLNESDAKNYVPKGLIVPHAGYIYSGSIAASAYRLLKKLSKKITRVIIIGPSHRVSVQGVAVSNADYFETPLGRLKVDTELRDKIIQETGIVLSEEAHRQEHCIEVQLPFLQMALSDNIKILPAVVNNASYFEVSHFLNLVWNGPETLIVVSSDLSHYQTYENAKRLDESTAKAITDFDLDSIRDDNACGSAAIKGFLMSSRERDLKPVLLDLRNSGDAVFEKDRVVGYGAFCFV